MFFDPNRDYDPRGIVNISVVGKIIKAKLQDTTTGKQLFEMEGKSARELLYKLKHFNFISRVDHAAFIGSELAKAEFCIKLGIEYKYDNPIILPNNNKILS
jgi:dihydropteroate synthase